MVQNQYCWHIKKMKKNFSMGNNYGDLREKEKTSDATLLAKKRRTYAV